MQRFLLESENRFLREAISSTLAFEQIVQETDETFNQIARARPSQQLDLRVEPAAATSQQLDLRAALAARPSQQLDLRASRAARPSQQLD